MSPVFIVWGVMIPLIFLILLLVGSQRFGQGKRRIEGFHEARGALGFDAPRELVISGSKVQHIAMSGELDGQRCEVELWPNTIPPAFGHIYGSLTGQGLWSTFVVVRADCPHIEDEALEIQPLPISGMRELTRANNNELIPFEVVLRAGEGAMRARVDELLRASFEALTRAQIDPLLTYDNRLASLSLRRGRLELVYLLMLEDVSLTSMTVQDLARSSAALAASMRWPAPGRGGRARHLWALAQRDDTEQTLRLQALDAALTEADDELARRLTDDLLKRGDVRALAEALRVAPAQFETDARRARLTRHALDALRPTRDDDEAAQVAAVQLLEHTRALNALPALTDLMGRARLRRMSLHGQARRLAQSLKEEAAEAAERGGLSLAAEADEGGALSLADDRRGDLSSAD